MTSRSPTAPSDPWRRKAQISYPVAGAIADWRALYSPATQSNTLLLRSSAFKPILRMIGCSALQTVRYTSIGHLVIIWELTKLGTLAPLISFLQPLPPHLSRPIFLFVHFNPANQICPAFYFGDLNRRPTRCLTYRQEIPHSLLYSYAIILKESLQWCLHSKHFFKEVCSPNSIGPTSL
jgi:hypothetical protein